MDGEGNGEASGSEMDSVLHFERPQPFPPRGDCLWTVAPGVLRGVIHGILGNKSNSRRLVIVKGRLIPIKEKAALAYEKTFKAAIQQSPIFEPLPDKTKLYLKATIYQENLRRDLDGELLPDLLQKFGVVKNDRLFWRKEYTRQIDKENPRVEFEVGVLL